MLTARERRESEREQVYKDLRMHQAFGRAPVMTARIFRGTLAYGEVERERGLGFRIQGLGFRVSRRAACTNGPAHRREPGAFIRPLLSST